MIFIAGGTLAFFFELLLLGKKNKCICDKILAFWMFILGIHLFAYYYFSSTKLFLTYPHVAGILNPLPLIHGPLLFLYTGSVTRYISKLKPVYLIHFLPVLVFMVIYFDFFVTPDNGKLVFVKTISKIPYNLYGLFYPSILISGFSYISLTWLLYRRHRRNILNTLSNFNVNNNLHWLRNIMIGMLAIWVVVFITKSVFHSPVDDIIYITVSLFVVFMGFFGFRQGDIFMNIPDKYLNEGLIVDNKPRYIKSGLKEEQAKEIKQQLEKIISERKLFLDENMSLPKLAGVLNIHPNYLSQVINEKFQMNFYDFINLYRIEEFKRIVVIEKNKNKTFFALAFDCGFNSKASFNNSFKKLTGITPSEFVKSA